MTASLYEGQVNALQKRRETQWPNDERHLPVERQGEGSVAWRMRCGSWCRNRAGQRAQAQKKR